MHLLWACCVLQVSLYFTIADPTLFSHVFPADLLKYWKETDGTIKAEKHFSWDMVSRSNL